MLVEAFNRHCDSVLYILQYLLLDDMVAYIRIFGTLFVFNSTLNEDLSVKIKHAYTRTLQSRRTRMRPIVSMIEKIYKTAQSYKKRKMMGRCDEKMKD